MERQGFDPMSKSIAEVVDFMENIESVEPTPTKSESKKKDTKKPKTSKKDEQKPPYYCKTHQANWSHDTKDCRNPNKENGNNNGGNKTWSRKVDKDKKKSQKELATIIARALKGQVKKHLASAKKKRKSDNDNKESKCFLVESLTGKLDGFNCNQMESLTLEDKISDEISV